jgi:hypothetical protein
VLFEIWDICHVVAAMTALLDVHYLIAYLLSYSLIAYPFFYTLITAILLVESWLAQSSSDDCG